MKILRLYNDTVDVQYKTDIITDTQSNFTVMQITGLDDAEKELGIDFKELPYNLQIFKKFAEENDLGLSLQMVGVPANGVLEILVELPTNNPPI